jgi:hypothetical protein
MRTMLLSLVAGALILGGLAFTPASALAGHVDHHRRAPGRVWHRDCYRVHHWHYHHRR